MWILINRAGAMHQGTLNQYSTKKETWKNEMRPVFQEEVFLSYYCIVCAALCWTGCTCSKAHTCIESESRALKWTLQNRDCDGLVQYTSSGQLCRSFSFSMWFYQIKLPLSCKELKHRHILINNASASSTLMQCVWFLPVVRENSSKLNHKVRSPRTPLCETWSDTNTVLNDLVQGRLRQDSQPSVTNN